MFRLWKITGFSILFTILILVWIFGVGVSSNQPGSFFNKEHNAVWIEHKWVGEPSTDAEIQALVNDLKEHQIDTVFVHSGPLKEDGEINPVTYRFAIDFLERAKKFDKDIQYQAWFGQIRSKIDLDNPDVRHNVAQQCMLFGQIIGFDGIHFDIEPVWDEDSSFIQTLDECRELLPDGKLISVALAEFIPESLIWFVEKVHKFDNYNTEVNYKNVADHANQIVVMTYDTSINSGWMYRWLVREQTIRLTDLLDDTEVFIGIPAYEEGADEAFNPEIENVENGLRGVIQGLNNVRSKEKNFAGVAIYPYWQIDDWEWKIYQDLWME